jgi:hypothetical protein
MKAADSYLGVQLSPHKVRSETDGSLICRAVVCRSGYQDYRPQELGIEGYDLVPVYRPKEEVLSKKFLASLEGVTICDDHPNQFVTPENHSWVSHGFAVNAARGPDVDGEATIAMDLHLKNESMIRAVQGGKSALSVGYTYTLENEDGRWTMRNLKANHLAVVNSARAGAVAQITDSNPSAPRWDRLLDAMRDAGAGFERMISKFHRRNAVDVDASEAVLRSDDPDSTRLPSQESMDEIETEEPMDSKQLLDAINANTAEVKRMFDTLIAMKNKPKAQDGECNCAGKKSHSDACPMYTERAEDMDESFSDRSTKPRTLGPDVIPVPGSGGEGNVNPTARDCEAALNNLRGIRHIVAESGDRKAIDAFNNAVKDVKRKLADALMRGPERVGPDRQAMDTQEKLRANGDDYEAQCAALHREDIKSSMSNEELSELSKKRRAKDAPRRVGDSQRAIAEDFEDSIKAARTKALTKK